jgi:hypothetical protein
MPYVEPKQAWYTFFFGVRGLLRLFVAMLAFSYTIFVCKFLEANAGSPFSRLTNAITVAAGRWEIILLFTGLFSIALWFGFHSDVEPRGWGLYRMFSEECEDYDWWGRRIEGKRRQQISLREHVPLWSAAARRRLAFAPFFTRRL